MATPQERRAAQRRTASALKAGQNPLKGEFAGKVKAATRKASPYIPPKTSHVNEQVASLPAGPEPALPHLLTGIGSGGQPSGPNLQMSAARTIGTQFSAMHPENRQSELIGAQAAGMKPSGPVTPNFPAMVGSVHSQPQRASLPGVKPLEGSMTYPQGPGWAQQPRMNIEGHRDSAMIASGDYGNPEAEVPYHTKTRGGMPAPVMGSKQLGGKKTTQMTIAEAAFRGMQRHTRMHGVGGRKISDYLATATSRTPDKGVTI